MNINNKEDLEKEIRKHKGRIILPPCMLSINGLSLDHMFHAIFIGDYEYIGTDDEEDIIVELCDSHMMTMASILWEDIGEFEICYEYDENGFIIP